MWSACSLPWKTRWRLTGMSTTACRRSQTIRRFSGNRPSLMRRTSRSGRWRNCWSTQPRLGFPRCPAWCGSTGGFASLPISTGGVTASFPIWGPFHPSVDSGRSRLPIRPVFLRTGSTPKSGNSIRSWSVRTRTTSKTSPSGTTVSIWRQPIFMDWQGGCYESS